MERNFLYKSVYSDKSVIDRAGVRRRKFRRVGSRRGFVEIADLPSFPCGCSSPCFSALLPTVLQKLWDGFKAISSQLSPVEKENRYIMNQLFCPLTNTSVRVCNRSITELYAVSEPVVSALRLVIQQFCEDPSLPEMPVREHGLKKYRERNHPMNRLAEHVVQNVERHLDMILRSDPAASDGSHVCRVYAPEINTHEKLRKAIATRVKADILEASMSPSSLRRMVAGYLAKRGCRISFTQADHNACPTCKSFQYEILHLHYEEKQLKERVTAVTQESLAAYEEEGPSFGAGASMLREQLSICQYRSEECIGEMKMHNERDARIRGFLKRVADHFRATENRYRADGSNPLPSNWRSRSDLALFTHQDDMTKVDLPHIIVSASADITRWRFDVNAHVNAITGDCHVFSHDQGTGSKNASTIFEEVLLDHILSCSGESIKIVVSDNAAVGKNWITTVALPQYFVDQGLADIVLVVYLENNHGKWLADMLFGQLQIRKRNTTILGVDGLLQAFESINRLSGGRVTGYVINPLAQIDFASILRGLGYETTPPKDFGFTNRNIQFAAACRQEAKAQLSDSLRALLVNALPDREGMVRLCSEPTNETPLEFRLFQERWIDVPAAAVSARAAGPDSSSDLSPPLVVPADMMFSASGPSVVSKRTAEHVGFNGLSFRGNASFPELNNTTSRLVRDAWPMNLLRVGEPGFQSESLRCAPENWIVRRAVGTKQCATEALTEGRKARYPPRNLLNALYCQGPRKEGLNLESEEVVRWIPTATYDDECAPVIENSSACEGLRMLSRENQDIARSVNVLDGLRCIFKAIGDREGVSDPWLQKRVTRASPHEVDKFRSEMKVLCGRDLVRPRAVLTLRQAFKDDDVVQKEIQEELRQMGIGRLQTVEEITRAMFQERFGTIDETEISGTPISGSNAPHANRNIDLQNFAKAVKQEVRKQVKAQKRQLSLAITQITESRLARRKLVPGGLDHLRYMVDQDKQRYARDLKASGLRMRHEFDERYNLLPYYGPLQRSQSPQSSVEQ